MSYDVL